MAFLHLVVTTLALAATTELQVWEFTSGQCAACTAMEPVVGQFVQKGYPLRVVNAEENRSLADRFQITHLPTFVVIEDGQETDRRVGQLNPQDLLGLFTARRAALPANAAPPANNALSGQTAPPANAAPPADGPRGASADWGAQTANPGAAGPRAGAAPAASMPTLAAAAGMNDPQKRAMQASVRIRVEDSQGHSFGSGTVVDAHGDELLLVTCGHIFRESDGKGAIWIDSHDESQRNLPGRLVSYDLNRDVGLVSFRAVQPIQPVPVGGTDVQLTVGQPVFSIGCDKGSLPSLRQSRVTALNKYLGPANVEVAGQPVDGRSGGGLFDAKGRLIGICNCADPQDDEGLYAALPSVHAELDRSRLSFVYQRADDGASPTSFAANPLNNLAPNSLAANSPAMNGPAMNGPAVNGPTMNGPAANSLAIHGAAITGQPASYQQPERGNVAGPASADPPSAAPSSLGTDTELICIVRSKQNPGGQSQMIVLDEPSLAILEQLQREANRQAQQRPTSWNQQR